MELKEMLNNDDFIKLTLFTKRLKPGNLRKKMIEFISIELKTTALFVLDLALKDKRITEEKIDKLIKKYGVKRLDIAEVFKLYYDKGIMIEDDSKEDKKFLMTIKDSPLWKLKDYVKKEHGFEVIDAKETYEKLQKPNKKDMNYIG